VSLVYVSTNGGVIWVSNPTTGTADILTVALAADGETLAAGNNIGRTLVSTNEGAAWARSNSLGATVTSLSASANGRRLAGVASGRGVYSSLDGGATWVSNSLPANSSWYAVAGSADGTELTALGQKSIIYSTTNGGAQWVTNIAPALIWSGAASSADGSVVFATSSNGGIWARRRAPTPSLRAVGAGNQLIFSWVLPAAGFVLQKATLITATNWVDLTNIPAIDPATLENRVTLPIQGGSAFYRLRLL
jgi:hypothetical protein